MERLQALAAILSACAEPFAQDAKSAHAAGHLGEAEFNAAAPWLEFRGAAGVLPSVEYTGEFDKLMAKPAPPSSFGLRAIALLEGLSPERLEALARDCAWRNFEIEQRIISRAAPDRDLYFIVSGRVRVTTFSAAGRQVTFRDYGAGEHFGEVAAIDGMPRTADVVGLEPGLLASLPPATLHRLLREQPALAERLLRDFAGLVRRLSERVVDLSTLGVHQRLHAELLRLARDAGVKANRARIDPAPKHADLASQVSTYREQVTRELSLLAKRGVLGKDGRALVVLDVARLQKMVEEVKSGA
jgi:CRP-like cAMP-binding protein